MKQEILTVEQVRAAVAKGKKKRKYGNKKTLYKGIEFDSILERDYYMILESRVKYKVIKSFDIQVRVDLFVNGDLISWLKVDFVITNNDGSLSYHDTKSIPTITPGFRIKAKLFKALFNKEIKIITRHNLH